MAFTFRTDDELDLKLNELAAVRNVSRQEVLRQAVLELHAQMIHRRSFAESLDFVERNWGDVLAQLGPR